LGLKYCTLRARPTNKIKKTIDRAKQDIRRMAYFKEHPPKKREGVYYIPQLYIKDTGWAQRLKANKEIEKELDDFEFKLRQTWRNYQKRLSLSNLTIEQWKLSEQLLRSDNHIVVEADKNLGGCVMERETYITKGILEHLGNKDVYKKLTRTEANNKTHIVRYKISLFLSKHKEDLSPAERNFLHEGLFKYNDKYPRFRMSAKVHKNPWKLRPIVCCAGTTLNCLSRWLDYWFQKLKPQITTYIKDSAQLLQKLKQVKQLPKNSWLFTADAKSMYTNIDTNHAIEVISKWLDSLPLPEGFPLAAVKAAMELVMCNNIFVWGDSYFLQLLGTAMGTSAACMWATIYFAVHEMGSIIPKFSNKLLLYLRFIDDIVGIWIGHQLEPAWKEFKEEVNNFGILEWEFEEPSKKVNFLDLTISIENKTIVTKTYQKAMNLYQYLSPMSNHPPSMIKGIIYSLLKTYKNQNTYTEDYLDVAVKLFKRHAARGWNKTELKRIILESNSKLEKQSLQPNLSAMFANPPEDATSPDRLFIHMEYSKNDMPKKAVRSIVNATLSNTLTELGISQTTVAYSRPKNIRDLLSKAKLHQADGKEVSKYYSGGPPST